MLSIPDDETVETTPLNTNWRVSQAVAPHRRSQLFSSMAVPQRLVVVIGDFCRRVECATDVFWRLTRCDRGPGLVVPIGRDDTLLSGVDERRLQKFTRYYPQLPLGPGPSPTLTSSSRRTHGGLRPPR